MKYCKETTSNHPALNLFPICLEELNKLICCEGYSGEIPFFSHGEVVINLDLLEEKLAFQENNRLLNKSMDFGFGVSNQDSSDKYFILSELRLNYDNPNNLKGEDVIGKVKGSLLSIKNEIPIYEKFIFIFKTNQLEEARSRMFRISPRIPNNYIVMDLQKLRDSYFN